MSAIRRGLLICALALLLAGVANAAAADWLTYGYDAARSNAFPAATGITRDNLGALQVQRIDVPGTVDSAPLYLAGLQVGGAAHDVFVVETTYGRTLAIDAATGATLWTYVPSGIAKWEGSNQYTTSTPVADPERRFLYVGVPDGKIHKLSLADGSEVHDARWPVTVTHAPKSEKLSSSLNLAGRYVIVAVASFQDRFPYQGHVVTMDRGSGKIAGVFNAVCGTHHTVLRAGQCKHNSGGIWGRGGAVVVPGSRRLIVTTGNAPLNLRDAFGDSLVELSPDANKVLSLWSPKDFRQRQLTDGDFGSASVGLLRYRGRLIAAQADKTGMAQIVDVKKMKRRGTPGRMPGLLDNLRVKPSLPFVSAPAIWKARNTVFWTNAGTTVAYRVGGRKPKLKKVWQRKLPGTSPVLAGGLLYVSDLLHGNLNVLDPATGKTLGSLKAAPGHWNSPVVADGRIALGTSDGRKHETTGSLYLWRLPGR